MRLPRIRRRWLVGVGCVLLGAGVASAALANELLTEGLSRKAVAGVWTTPTNDGRQVWWFRPDGTFSAWTAGPDGTFRPADHGLWSLSGRRLTLESITPPKAAADGPSFHLNQWTVVRADGELVLAGWEGESLRLKRR